MTRTPTGGGERASGRPFFLLALAFLASRLAVFVLPPPDSDVGIYERYAREYQAAADRGVPFYQFHADEVRRQAEKARADGSLTAPIEEYKDVEYPPLAVALMRLPALRSPEVPYYLAFRAGMAVVDGALFALLAALVRRFFPCEGPGERARRLLAYLVITLALWHLLYDRLDLLLTALIVLALALLTARLHYGWSFAVLAAAILLKLVPVVLAPLWVVGSMPAGRPLALGRPRVLAGLAARAALLGALAVAGFAPFYLSAGAGCLGFLAYHRARPLEIGSLGGSLALALGPLTPPTSVSYSYGSINVHSPLTPTLAGLSPWLTAAALLAATVLLLSQFRGLSSAPAGTAPPGATLAQLHPLPVVLYTLLLLMLFIATGKVFSTQYLLWLAPLVALLPPAGWRRLFTWTFLLTCVLSTVLVPFLFLSDLIDLAAPPAPPLPLTLREPTPRLMAVLLTRNLLFLGLVAGLAARLARSARAGATRGGRAEA
jgi:hypothetical protein